MWCRDFTIVCIAKKLEVKMPACTSFISDVHKCYGGRKNSFALPDIFIC